MKGLSQRLSKGVKGIRKEETVEEETWGFCKRKAKGNNKVETTGHVSEMARSSISILQVAAVTAGMLISSGRKPQLLDMFDKFLLALNCSSKFIPFRQSYTFCLCFHWM